MPHLFTKDGGLFVADDELEIATYAYPSSTDATKAQKNSQHIFKIKEELVRNAMKHPYLHPYMHSQYAKYKEEMKKCQR